MISYVIYLFSGMAKRFSTEEAADLIVNDEFDNGEMDSADSLDEDWSSDEEPTSQFGIESDDHGAFYSGCQVLIHSQKGTNVTRKGVRTHGGLVRGTQTTCDLSTGGRAIRGCLERGARTHGCKHKRNDLYDKSSRESESSNEEEENSVNQRYVTLDNTNLPGDSPSSADDRNPANEGSETIDNSNFADDNSSEGDESDGNSNDNWSSANPVLKVLQFNENEGMKIDFPADDNLLFFFNLFVIVQLLIQSSLQ